MEKLKFTQGPWLLHHNGDGSYAILGKKIADKTYQWVATFSQNGEISTAEQLANAKLMAKAPEMYDAMKLFCDRVDKEEIRSTKAYNQFKGILNEIDS